MTCESGELRLCLKGFDIRRVESGGGNSRKAEIQKISLVTINFSFAPICDQKV